MAESRFRCMDCELIACFVCGDQPRYAFSMYAASRAQKGNKDQGSAVHKLQPPRMRQRRVQDLPTVPRIDMPRRRGVRRSYLTAECAAAAEVFRRQAAVPARALPVSPMPEMPEGDA